MSNAATNKDHPAAAPVVQGGVMPGESERQAIIDYLSAELDHNEKWVLIHKAAGQPNAAKYRRDHCKKLLCWLEWLYLVEPDMADTEEDKRKELSEAVAVVKGISETCIRCGRTPDDFLYATESHILRVKHLTLLVDTIERLNSGSVGH